LDYLTTHTSLSPIRRGFAPGFVNYKKGALDSAASDKAYQLLAHGRWFSPGTPASSTTKIGCHDIAEILLKVALNTINQIKSNQLNIVVSNNTKRVISKTLTESSVLRQNMVISYSNDSNRCPREKKRHQQYSTTESPVSTQIQSSTQQQISTTESPVSTQIQSSSQQQISTTESPVSKQIQSSSQQQISTTESPVSKQIQSSSQQQKISNMVIKSVTGEIRDSYL
jgi:hypothetical protein